MNTARKMTMARRLLTHIALASKDDLDDMHVEEVLRDSDATYKWCDIHMCSCWTFPDDSIVRWNAADGFTAHDPVRGEDGREDFTTPYR